MSDLPADAITDWYLDPEANPDTRPLKLAPILRFMFSTGRESEVRINQIQHLQEEIDGLRETVSTFHPRGLDGVNAREIPDPMLYYLGSWRIPNTYNTGVRWVNPGYEHKQRFGDAADECECGWVLTSEFYPSYTHAEDSTVHADHCRRHWRLAFSARVHHRRWEIVRTGAALGQDSETLRNRSLWTAEGKSFAQRAELESLKVEELWKESQLRKANTAAELLTEFRPSELTPVFGVKSKRIPELVNQYTPYSASSLYNYRRGEITIRQLRNRSDARYPALESDYPDILADDATRTAVHGITKGWTDVGFEFQDPPRGEDPQQFEKGYSFA